MYQKLTITGSDNGLAPIRRQAIIWSNAGILLIETLGTDLPYTIHPTEVWQSHIPWFLSQHVFWVVVSDLAGLAHQGSVLQLVATDFLWKLIWRLKIYINPWCFLTHWGRDEMNNILQTTFSNVFSSMKMFEFRLKFHWSLFPRVQLTIFQNWFR